MNSNLGIFCENNDVATTADRIKSNKVKRHVDQDCSHDLTFVLYPMCLWTNKVYHCYHWIPLLFNYQEQEPNYPIIITPLSDHSWLNDYNFNRYNVRVNIYLIQSLFFELFWRKMVNIIGCHISSSKSPRQRCSSIGSRGCEKVR